MPAPTVLILKPSSLGDIVHTLPAVARFRAARPGWRVRWLVNPEFSPLLEENPVVEEIVRFPRASFRGPAAPARVWRWLRSEWRRAGMSRPELALDFQGLLRTALLGRLSGARALHGLSDAREGAAFFYGRTVPAPPGPVHAVRRYLALVDALLPAAPSELPVEFPLPPGEPWPEALPDGGFIALHPFARGAGKSLTPAQVEAFCRELAPRPVLVIGRGGGAALGALPGNAWNLLDRTSLAQLLWLVRRAAFVLSVDSGPAHLAAAALADPGRLAAIHAWTDPRRVGPFPARAWVWKSGRLCRVGELPAGAGEPARKGASRLEEDLGARDIGVLCALAGEASGAG